jgi:diacylglycerol kinase (ATP)
MSNSPAGAPKTFALLLNATSANGRATKHWHRIATALQDRGHGVQLLLGTTADQSLELAGKAVADGVDALVAVGGDGTVGVALQAVASTETPLGIIPLGTGNDNARMLGIPFHPARAVRIVAEAQPRRIDVGSVTTASSHRYFLSVAAVGYDARANERANRMSHPKGQARYLIAGLAELAALSPVDFTITVDGRVHHGPTTLVAVGNGAYYGGGMMICPAAVIDDGLLTMTWVGSGSRVELLRHLPKIYRGTHLGHSSVIQLTGREFRIEAPDQVAYAEGDRIGGTPLTIRVHPGALRVLAPMGG